MPTAREPFQADVMGWPEIASTVAGVVLLPIVFYDLFQTVVLPRPAVRKFQLARYLVRPMWMVWRWVGLRSSSRVDRSEGRLAAFAPIALIVLILLWALGLILGYGMILYGVRDQFRPELADFPEAFYVSASTLVPLAYGDFVPEQGFARFLIVLESANGVAFGAAAITLLFELYGSFRAREEAVVALDALAGAPPRPSSCWRPRPRRRWTGSSRTRSRNGASGPRWCSRVTSPTRCSCISDRAMTTRRGSTRLAR